MKERFFIVISLILFYFIAMAGGGLLALAQYESDEPGSEIILDEDISVDEIDNIESEADSSGLGFFQTFENNAMMKFQEKTEQMQAEDEEEYLFIKKKRREFRRIQDRASL